MIRPRLYEARPDTLAVPVLPLLNKVDVGFVRAEATQLDTTTRTVTLATGEQLAYDRLVVATGSRAPATPEIFVAGDAAAADTGDGHLTLQSCQHAGQLGRVAGENAARDLLGKPLLSYSQLPYLACLDLGRSGAVVTHGWERRIEKTGAEANSSGGSTRS